MPKSRLYKWKVLKTPWYKWYCSILFNRFLKRSLWNIKYVSVIPFLLLFFCQCISWAANSVDYGHMYGRFTHLETWPGGWMAPSPSVGGCFFLGGVWCGSWLGRWMMTMSSDSFCCRLWLPKMRHDDGNERLQSEKKINHNIYVHV